MDAPAPIDGGRRRPVTAREVNAMIARLWRGQTTVDNADAYENLLRTKILPGIHSVEGYRGAYVLRRDVEAGVEFVTLTLFDSMEAVRAFAGPSYETAVVLPEAEALLARFDQASVHYEIAVQPD
jgi:heme-degrading monooxygenase HmoA